MARLAECGPAFGGAAMKNRRLSSHATWAIGALASACSLPSSAGYDSISLEITHFPAEGEAETTNEECFTLPILLGSRAQTFYPLDQEAVLVVDATRDNITFETEGAVDHVMRSFSLEELESKENTPIKLSAEDGSSFRLVITRGCR